MEINQPGVSGSGSGKTLTVETPVGTVNGSNTVYTVLNQPVWIAVDGVDKFVTLNYTYLAGTITITDGAPPVFSIYSFYNA